MRAMILETHQYIKNFARAMQLMPLMERSIENLKKQGVLSPIRSKLQKALQKAFLKQGELFLEELEELRGFFPEEEIKEAVIPPWYTWAQIELLLLEAQLGTLLLFQMPIDAAVRAALMAGGFATIAELAIKPTFDIAASPGALDYLKEYGAERVAQIDATTREYIKTQVSHAMEEGWSYNRTAKAITDRYKEFAIGKPQEHIRSRAHLVAVTETGNAYVEGQMQTGQWMQSLGLEVEKYWQNVGDDKVSDGCLGNTAAGWIPLDDRFPNGPNDMRPLRFPGCRCGLQQRVSPD